MELKSFIFSDKSGHDIAEFMGVDADDAAMRLWGKTMAQLPGISARIRK